MNVYVAFMTTRSGKGYKESTPGIMAGEFGESVAQLLKELLEDRKQREEGLTKERELREQQLTEERKLREEERKLREEEMKVEKERRDEESKRRDEEMKRQLEMLQTLVSGISTSRSGESGTVGRMETERNVKVAKLMEEDDIEAYLTTFERMMRAYEVKRERWAYKLAPQLSGRAQQAYAAMSAADAGNYEKMKLAILRRYDINEETYRQRFRSAQKKAGESNRDLVVRLQDLATKWMQEHKNADEQKDLIVREQLINSLPDDVRIWVKERKPKTSEEAGALADDYVQARKKSGKEDHGNTGDRKQENKQRRCHRCNKWGHIAKECRAEMKEQEKKDPPPDRRKSGRDLKDVECFNCHRKGHYSSNCPENALLCVERRLRHPTDDVRSWEAKRHSFFTSPGGLIEGLVEGQEVKNILLDTGCSRTLVRKDLVPEEKFLCGRAITICCAHGDTSLYPLARVKMVVNGKTIEVEAAAAEKLPMAVLLGTDVPELRELLTDQLTTTAEEDAEALAVTTRSRARCEQWQEEQRLENERAAEVHPKAIEDNGEEEELDLPDFDDDLFIGGRERARLSRSEKRRQRRLCFDEHLGETGEESAVLEDNIRKNPLDITAEELQAMQEEDPSLEEVRLAADGQPSSAGVGFFRRDGIIYRRWVRPGQSGEEVEQVVVPEACRESLLELAHSIPLAGHLGREKTVQRLLARFYWPTLYRDVAQFCKYCAACQKTGGRRVKAPLIPLPIMTVPFERIAMDIVGPLPRSRSGKRYVLVICDYATRYPEAIPLRTIDAGHVAEALVEFFSRVGVPGEILTDQGSNFTSQLLIEIYRMLHIHPIRTTPYHPQTDGLVERFNRTLKSMLRKAATSEGKDWDKVLPYLLFAYREVPQASTGFSPFELLYGRPVRGPLDVLKESWVTSQRSDESVVSHVLSMRSKLEKMTELVKENMEVSQSRQKKWYDKGARLREFSENDQVLILLPTTANKLLASWQGPYRVVKKVGKTSYQVDMHDRRKRRRTFHVNMLRQFHLPKPVFFADEVESEEDVEEDIQHWGSDPKSQPTYGSSLTEQQRADLDSLMLEFQDVVNDKPGRTDLAEHQIPTKAEARPVRLPAYRVPHAYKDVVREELREMLAQGIVEPSISGWSSPIVLVKKGDGSLRLCIDYRRLNDVSAMDAYPMPRIDDLIDQLGKAKYISTLDLTRGYWQIPVAAEDRPKTAFSSPFGLFQFRVMPFGLQSAPATFQRLIDQVIRGLKGTAAYLDDIIVFSQDWESHLAQLRAVLRRLKEAGPLTVRPKKCSLGMRQCIYLGHVVGNGCVQPEANKVEAVRDFTRPTTKKQVRAFLGLSGYYRRFIPRYSSISTPLTDLKKKSLPFKVQWTRQCEEAFIKLKQCLCTAPVLTNPDFEKTFFCKPMLPMLG